MLNIPEDGQQISKRFFLALETLKAQGKIRGLKTFTDRHNLNYGNMNTLRSNIDKRTLRVEYLAYIVKDFGISSDWLLLGIGDMFKQRSSKI